MNKLWNCEALLAALYIMNLCVCTFTIWDSRRQVNKCLSSYCWCYRDQSVHELAIETICALSAISLDIPYSNVITFNSSDMLIYAKIPLTCWSLIIRTKATTTTTECESQVLKCVFTWNADEHNKDNETNAASILCSYCNQNETFFSSPQIQNRITVCASLVDHFDDNDYNGKKYTHNTHTAKKKRTTHAI